MDTFRLKKFAQYARRSLIEQVESKLKLVLAEESEARRESPKAVAELEKKLAEQHSAGNGKQKLIEQVSYTWFNRFCALRFMDVNQYNRIMVISPLAGQFQPEILAEAKAGHIDDGIVSEAAREKVFGLLSGSIASRDGQSEAFRQLIVAVCNDLHRIMPYLFERIEDYTELLMPDDLLSGNSILAYTREAMTPEACESVESIGWLYQFYISEKKDEVFASKSKVEAKDIPAATQLFTPHYIVRYLVENSLGRLWMLNNPSSKVIENMDYYIKPVEEEKDYHNISSPEEIRICDPACGSGHMLTYAYDLLYSIYQDAGYDSTEIPEKILSNNLYGIEIDERAAELAAFALTMKAIKGDPQNEGNNRRRFFLNPVEPNICRLKKVSFADEELDSYINFAGRGIFTPELRETLKQFEEADNFGSLIQPAASNVSDVFESLSELDWSNELLQEEPHKKALRLFSQADYLSQKYHVVIANPPYMGGKGMNQKLGKMVKDFYPDSKADLFGVFIERCKSLVFPGGSFAMVTMQSWMFLSSFERLRTKLLLECSLNSMAHLGTRAFDSIGGEVVSTTAFVFSKIQPECKKSIFIRLVDGVTESEKRDKLLAAASDESSKYRYVLDPDEFRKIPAEPIAYWAPAAVFRAFEKGRYLSDFIHARIALATGDNDAFVRSWQEVSFSKIGFSMKDGDEAERSALKWFPCNKGGEFRKWYGNNENLLNWESDGRAVKSLTDPDTGRIRSHNYNGDFGFKESVTWSALSSGSLGVRYSQPGSMFVTPGSSAFKKADNISLYYVQSLLSSKVADYFLMLLSPTLNIEVGNILRIPVLIDSTTEAESIAKSAVEISKKDWDRSEVSWDFSTSPLLEFSNNERSLREVYANLLAESRRDTADLLSLEIRNNELFIEKYGVSEVVEAVPSLNEVSLNCNPHYQYRGKGTAEAIKELERQDCVKDFISYSVGCFLGRYSLDKEGLILANQGDTLEDYLKQVPLPSFTPDDDNVIPLIDFDGDWFEDDISERFKQFLKVTFGEENFAENLSFVEEAVGKDIKKFFLKDFYVDHVKRYKKRPIYWMFSSPKGSFNALIYMHRYRPDTVSVVLNDYLREFRTKLQARKESHEQIEVSATASQKEKTQAIKATQKINKVLDEINDYEHDTLYPLAGKSPEIDLDDGVKHNYPLFGKALKKVTGLS